MPGHFSANISVPVFKKNKYLDPKRVLAIYLKKTKPLRNNDGRDEVSLFLTINSPSDKASARTLGQFIVTRIQGAYHDSSKKVRAHSTRSLGPSWALCNGAFKKPVLEAGQRRVHLLSST